MGARVKVVGAYISNIEEKLNEALKELGNGNKIIVDIKICSHGNLLVGTILYEIVEKPKKTP